MNNALRTLVLALAAAVALSFLTNHDYLWGGIRETWLRGWENAQIDDLPFRTFVRTIPASSNPQPWPEGPLWGKAVLTEEAEQWHADNKTASFLVIQHDSLVHESCRRGHNATTLTNAFSMTKSITALAVGLAVGQGDVDEDAPLAKYLPRFGEGLNAQLTVQQVLHMRSSIPFGESYKDPFGFQAKAYYRDGNRALLEPYRVQGTPGAPFEYQGGNTMLLSEMLDRVREGNLSQDIANGLWEQMGAEHDAFWGLDGDPAEGAVERSFAQFYATTRDFARFGQLLVDTGAWKGQQLIDKGFVTRMITPQNELVSGVDTDFYGHQIWLGTTDDGLPFSLMEGLRGQMVISVPALDLVVVRTGYRKSKLKKRHLPVAAFEVLDIARDLLQTSVLQ